MRKRYGTTTVRLARDIPQPFRISTGSFILDFSLLGGVPHNRSSMVVGERHAGKSLISSKIARSAQHMFPDQSVVLIDAEGTFDKIFAQKLGVDLDQMIIIECETGEMAADVGCAMIESREVSIVITDSIAAMTPMVETEASIEDPFVALQARLISRFVRKMTSALIKERKRNHYVTNFYTNQFRMRIGGYGDPRIVPGGKALSYCTSLEFIIKNKENKGKDTREIEDVLTNEHSFTVTKNKCNSGPRVGEFVLLRVDDEKIGLKEGDIDDSATVLTYAKKMGFYTGEGTAAKVLDFDESRYRFKKNAQAIQMLRDEPETYWALRCKLIQEQAEHLGMSREFIRTIQ